MFRITFDIFGAPLYPSIPLRGGRQFMSRTREARTDTKVVPIGTGRRAEAAPEDASLEVTPTREAPLLYHEQGRPGKLEVIASKPVFTQRDLSLAYTPGVAEPCREIQRDRSAVNRYTARRNLVAVITNGTAVLGLGDLGPYAAKPVMEGKAVLFKRFADIDVFDIEIDAQDPERLIETIAALEPTFGGINLEDIKAPECFIVEKALRLRLS